MKFLPNQLSKEFITKQLKQSDIPEILKLYQGNPYYYKHYPPEPTIESIKQDMLALPPKKTLNEKYFLGFFKESELVAVMDLILSYPNNKTCFIGFFMMKQKYQHKGLASKIVQDSLLYLKNFYEIARLGYVATNEQSKEFWQRNGFKCTGENKKLGLILMNIMEKELK